ncbi:MAG TPA: hypothetical protein VHK91_05200 [Flavisolibacter sp.]|jgi:hypothetical protein|nr:hypothetical protein [Flavisolibacter sp.]
MKKIITLLLALVVFAGAKAQSSSEEARRVILGYPKTTNGSGDSRDVVLGRNNGSHTTYPTRTNKRNRDDYGQYNHKRKNKCGNGRKDNGNHYGWTKGKGNRGKKH